eukprot:gb/GECH01000911.1/.p1 GENE.gb/GECH01000911.1/~~gb/GECH01000911.1/.p1  ORF type:complete len:122 (+),score=21.20 gb/GECH01000911.1/:1-366(+)
MGEIRNAAKRGYLDTVQHVVDSSTDINKLTNGYAPLHHACLQGHLSITKNLLQRRNININIQNRDQRTPLHLACFGGYHSIVKELLKCDNINVNMKDNNGKTPLHIACERGRVSAVKELLK